MAETRFSSAPKIIDTFFSEKLSISTSNSIAIHVFLPIPLSPSNLTCFSPSGNDIPPFPRNFALFPVNDLIFSLLDTYIKLFNTSLLYNFLAIIIFGFSSYCTFI